MAMFGAKGDFLDPYGFRTPPIHGGPADSIPMNPAGELPKPGFMAPGGRGQQLLGGLDGIADTLIGVDDPGYLQSVQQGKRADDLYARRQQDDQDQWMSRELWKRANPEATNPYRWEANDGSLMEMGPDGKPRIAYQDPTPKLNWITADNGDGTKTIVPVGPNGPMTGQPSRPTVGAVIADPRKGGPTSQASGGFR